MGITEFKAIIGMWLLAQAFIAPLFIIDVLQQDGKTVLAVDFGALVLLMAIYFGLKLIGV